MQELSGLVKSPDSSATPGAAAASTVGLVPPLESVINALSAHVAILDNNARILLVNAAWHRFAEQNGFQQPHHGVGGNYLEVCDLARGGSADGADRVAEGIRQLMRQRNGAFQCDYACHSNTEQRWFHLSATSFSEAGTFYILLAHENISALKAAEQALRESETREQQRASELETVLQAVPAVVWIAHDPECHHITGNISSDEMLRLPRGAESSVTAPVNRPTHFTPMKDGRKLQPEELPVQRAARGAVVNNFEFSVVFDDGTTRHLLGNASPLRDEQGVVRGAVSAFVDITERKEAEAKVVESEAIERMRRAEVEALLEAIPAPVWVATDASCRFIRGNRAAQEVLGGRTDQNLSRSAPDAERPTFEVRRNGALLPPDQLPMQRAAAAGAPVTGEEIDIVRADGSTRSLYGNSVPLFDAKGVVRGCVGVMVDITGLKQVEHALKLARTQLEAHAQNLEKTVAERTAKLNETITDLETFSASISHDLRAPLRSLLGYAQILLEDSGESLSPTGADLLRRIIASADRMETLIGDILKFSRISRGELALDRVDLEGLLSALIEAYPAFQSPSAHVEVRRPLPAVRGNETALTQCFANLLGNAVKYVAPGVRPRIVILAEQRGERVRFWCADNGIGIAPEHHERIFGIFQRLQKGHEGTGVGLALVKKAVERMGGRVGVESELGKGSRFWIELLSA
jgi:PAS domain S-box-containing protein